MDTHITQEEEQCPQEKHVCNVDIAAKHLYQLAKALLHKDD